VYKRQICNTKDLTIYEVLPEKHTWKNLCTNLTQFPSMGYGSNILHIRTHADALEAIKNIEKSTGIYMGHFERSREHLKIQIAMIRELQYHMGILKIKTDRICKN